MSGQQPNAEMETLPGSGTIVLAISSDCMGRGDDELGRMLMRVHLHVLAEAPRRPDTLVLFNSGVKLAAKSSPALDDLKSLAAQGANILLCGTCVGYYDLKDTVAVGEISNMHDITDVMLTAGKVINL
jgi:selenium metabolism protein YedF